MLSASFMDFGGTDAFVLQTFIAKVQTEYLPNAFHSFCHAVDVLQMVFQLGRLMPWQVFCSPSVQFALMIAAVAHDVGHPGFNNVFLVEACDALAYRYNDASPLENMHCSTLFEILRSQGCDLFGHLPRHEVRELRRLMIDAIIHTDTAYHASVTVALDDLYREHREVFRAGLESCHSTKEQPTALSISDNQAVVARALLHCADLSHAARPWKVAQAWAQRMQEELFIQGDQERSMGLLVQPQHNREMAALPDMQLGFIHAAVAPLVSAEVRLFRSWRQLAETLVANTEEWGSELAARDEAEQAVADSRVHSVRTMVEDALQGRFGPTSSSGPLVEEPCSEPSVTCCALEVPARPALVREVRRWREQRVDGQHQRELVLLYVVSEAAGGARAQGQPILFRYAVRDDSPGAPEATFSQPAPALQAVDATCMSLDSGGFDALLSGLLVEQTTQIQASEEPQEHCLR